MSQISIIIPCYNAQAYLEKTIASVQSQTLSDWELVIIDDGSTDATFSIAERHAASDSRLHVFHQENAGVCAARNAGCRVSMPSTKFLLFLDQDDCLKPEMLATLCAYLDAHPSVGLAHCVFDLIDENDRKTEDKRDFRRLAYRDGRLQALPADEAATPFESIFWWCPLLPSACLIRRSVYDKTPGWDETFGHGSEDIDLFLNISLVSDIHYVPQPLVLYRLHAEQASKKASEQQRQQMRLFRKWLAPGGRGTRLAREQSRWLLQTWRLYEGRVVPRFWLSRAAGALRRRQVAESARCLARGAKHVLLYLSRPAGNILWRPFC